MIFNSLTKGYICWVGCLNAQGVEGRVSLKWLTKTGERICCVRDRIGVEVGALLQ